MPAPPGRVGCGSHPLLLQRSYSLWFTLASLRDAAASTILPLVPLLYDIREEAAGTEKNSDCFIYFVCLK